MDEKDKRNGQWIDQIENRYETYITYRTRLAYADTG